MVKCVSYAPMNRAYKMLHYLEKSGMATLILRCLAACHDRGLEYNQTDIMIAIQAHMRTAIVRVKNDQSQVSNTLTTLRRYGLIKAERRGRERYYSIIPERIAQINRIASEL